MVCGFGCVIAQASLTARVVKRPSSISEQEYRLGDAAGRYRPWLGKPVCELGQLETGCHHRPGGEADPEVGQPVGDAGLTNQALDRSRKLAAARHARESARAQGERSTRFRRSPACQAGVEVMRSHANHQPVAKARPGCDA